MKKLRTIIDPGKREQLSFAAMSCSKRTAEAGLELKPIGAINVLRRVGESSPVMVYNSGNSVAYVKFGDDAVSAAVSPSDGIPVLAGEKCVLNSGSGEYIIGSSASLYGYVGDSE